MNESTYHNFFTNLANPLKIQIILCLKRGARNVSELISCLKVEQSKASHALANLKACNIVEVETRGKQRIYSLNKDTILPILNIIDKHASKFCHGNCMRCKKQRTK